MHMPIIDGYDCARSIRNLGVSTKIIALSANSLKFEIDKAKKFGCDEYVIKPVTKNTIIEKVNKLILA